LNCTDGSSKNCINCPHWLFLYDSSQCVSQCPNGTYTDFSNKICKKCESSCASCLSFAKCTSCNPPYFLYENSTKEACVLKCPDGYLENNESRKCEKCHRSCGKCVGPLNTHCLTCKTDLGYYKIGNKEPSVCYQFSCMVGYYSYEQVDPHNSGYFIKNCFPCHSSCKTCIAGDKYSCTSCNKGRFPLLNQTTNLMQCISCQELNPGFYTTIDGKCAEICGDGINLGQVECDDGNRINNDGCNSNCMVEYGYTCEKRFNNSDICYDNLPPLLYMRVLYGNIIQLEFSELVLAGLNSTQIKNKIEINIKECSEFEWDFANNFTANQHINRVLINTQALCHLTGHESIIFKILSTGLFKDTSGNALKPLNIKTNAHAQNYMTDVEKAVMENTGNFFSLSSMVTFGIIVGVNMIQMTAVESFWTFINMLQMLSIIPLVDCNLPANLMKFFIEYLSVAKVALPVEIVPYDFISKFENMPYNRRFAENGYENTSIIVNFIDQLTTWILLIIFYLIITILTYVVSQDSILGFIYRWKKEYEFNAVIRILLESFLTLCICCFIDLWTFNFTNKYMVISIFCASFLFVFLLAIIFKSILKLDF